MVDEPSQLRIEVGAQRQDASATSLLLFACRKERPGRPRSKAHPHARGDGLWSLILLVILSARWPLRVFVTRHAWGWECISGRSDAAD